MYGIMNQVKFKYVIRTGIENIGIFLMSFPKQIFLMFDHANQVITAHFGIDIVLIVGYIFADGIFFGRDIFIGIFESKFLEFRQNHAEAVKNFIGECTAGTISYHFNGFFMGKGIFIGTLACQCVIAIGNGNNLSPYRNFITCKSVGIT